MLPASLTSLQRYNLQHAAPRVENLNAVFFFMKPVKAGREPAASSALEWQKDGEKATMADPVSHEQGKMLLKDSQPHPKQKLSG